MAITDLISKIIADDAFSGTFDKYNKYLDGADGKTSNFERSLAGLAGPAVAATGTLVAAGAAVKQFTDAAVTAETAQVNLGVSANAASREFGAGVGTAESWRATLTQLGDQTRIYGDTELANATTRLIDMTKRLGLNEEQMKTVLQRTIDLSAGKTDLQGGIERVTSALRGEAESAEYLGLSLSDTAVRNYAAAQGLAYAALSDNEKAQLRYQMLLDQTNQTQGRAAVYASTLAGQEAALNSQWERQSAVIGQQLLPLRQGLAEGMKLLGGTAQGQQGIISQALAGILATLLTIGAGFKAMADSAGASLEIVGAGLTALAQGKNPLEAIAAAANKNKMAFNEWGQFITTIPATFDTAFNQTLDGWKQQTQAVEELEKTTLASAGAPGELANATTIAAQQAADAYEKAKQQQERATTQYNQRMAALEFEHAQRVRRINEETAAAISQAHADAATAISAAETKLGQDLAKIDADAATKREKIEQDYSKTMSDLRADRKKAETEYQRDIADLERETATARAEAISEYNKSVVELTQQRQDAETTLSRGLADLERETATARAEIVRQGEADKAALVSDYAAQRLKVEQDYQEAVKSLNADYEAQYAEADPFKRKILEYNRQEQLKQLEAQKTEEQTALATQETAALTALQAKIAREAAALDADAAAKKLRLDQEYQDELLQVTRKQTLLDQELAEKQAKIDADDAVSRQKLQQRLNDELASIQQQQAQARAARAQELAELAQQNAAAKAQLDQRHAEELAAIQQQEQKKIEQANQALARENQNYNDRLAQARFANQQEMTALNAKLSEAETAERESYSRRLEAAQDFYSQISQMAGPNQSGSAGYSVSNSTSNNVTVNSYGTPGGYAGAAQIGRTVKDVQKGF